MFVRDLYSPLASSLHRLSRWKELVEGSKGFPMLRLRFSLFMIVHVWCVTCVSFPSLSLSLSLSLYLFLSSFLAGPSETLLPRENPWLNIWRARARQLRRDSETPNKRLGIGKDTVHYEIPPGNQRTEPPPFANAMGRTLFNESLTITLLCLIFSNILLLATLER